MAIGDIKKAISGFVRDTGQKSVETARAMARAPVLSAQLTQVNLKLVGLKGWGPEVKAQRQGLEAERKQIMTNIEANQKLLPDANAVIRNLKA